MSEEQEVGDQAATTAVEAIIARKKLANPYPRTSAMAAGISNHIWTVEEIIKLAE